MTKAAKQEKPQEQNIDPEGESIIVETPQDNKCRDIVHNHPDLICKWLPDGTLTFANEAFCCYFGKPAEDLIGKTRLDCIHPEDQNKLAKHIARFCTDQPQAMIELRIVNPEGKVRWLQWIDKYTANEKTGQVEFLSTGRDITARKMAELELNRRMEFEHLITNLSIDFINLPLDDIDNHIDHLLAEIGQLVDVDRSYVFLFDEDSQTLSNTHEWCRVGIDPQIENLQNLSVDSLTWWVSRIKNFETIIIPKVKDLPDEARAIKELLQEQDILSVICVPLIYAGSILGFVGFDSIRVLKTWAEDDVMILQIIGNLIGSTFIQKKRQQDTKRRVSFLEQLNQLTLASINANSVDDMLNVVVDQIGNLIGASGCYITLWDEKTKQVRPVIASKHLSENYRKTVVNSGEVSMTASVLNAGRALVAEDVHNSPYISPRAANLFLTKSMLGVPLIAEGNKLGAVLLSYEETHHFTEKEIVLAYQAASQISQALLRLRLLEQAQISAREAETLHKAIAIVASTLELDLAIESMLDQLELVVPFDSASVQILSDDHLEIIAGKGWPTDQSPVGMKFPIPGNNPNSKVILSGQPYVLNDAPEFYQIFDEPFHSNIRSWLGVPLIVRDEVIGMLTLDHHEPNFYGDERLIDLATAFADHVGISLENARLYANERQRVRELDALRATTADITKELALENLLKAILVRATSLLNATGGELGLVDETGEQIKVLVSHNMGVNNVGISINKGKGLMGHVAETRQIEMIEDYQHWAGQLETYQQSKIHAAIAAPLMIGNRFLGVIGIMNSDRRRKFSDSEKSLMSLFAQQAAIAVQNAQLYEERKHQARTDLTTGVYNRRGLFELAQRELDRAERYERPLAAIMLDIDEFKNVNDTYGHPIGDIVLKELAYRLKNNLRSIDILGRYGGDEFVIMLPETTVDCAHEIAERLCKIIKEEPFTPTDLSLPITISLGIAITDGKRCDLNTLIKHADEAMYKSKRAGCNCVSLYNHEL